MNANDFLDSDSDSDDDIILEPSLCKSLLIQNKHRYHYEIIESVIVKHHEILNIEKGTQLDIYLDIYCDNDMKHYLIDKYPILKFGRISNYDYYINCTIYDCNFDIIDNDKNSKKRYISHEITDRLKNNPNVYFLTPLAKTKFIYADILPYYTEKKVSSIPIYVIQGNMSSGRRYFKLLAKILEHSYKYEFTIKLIGRGTLPKELIKFKSKIVLKNNLSFTNYHKEFLDAYCILPLISKKTHPRYYNDKLTSTINYARAYKLKCIIDKDLQEIYNLDNIEVFNDIDDITISFTKTLEQFYQQQQ